ncbi:type II toxin-antitoxin system HicB family antitoxin [Levilactobacillus angrenensis]|uniref:Type II toxin-antitoxin system HicB family antitoxin n=1 Tax=Levilactobacillus angrenensis TaxID=2486020 RepID=A0ABW1U6Q6_9LACO|nr:type II toxin-antitoxin system HicB family antitoxin [Levilactobacillus angrenensis]
MQTKLVYPIIAQENDDADGHYFVGFTPNLPGVVTHGGTLVDLVINAEDAIATMLDGESYPAVQDPRKWTLQANESIIYVTVDITAWQRRNARKVRRTIAVPQYLSEMVDQRKIDVSRLTIEALEDVFRADR